MEFSQFGATAQNWIWFGVRLLPPSPKKGLECYDQKYRLGFLVHLKMLPALSAVLLVQ